jgi:hypothetical protein
MYVLLHRKLRQEHCLRKQHPLDPRLVLRTQSMLTPTRTLDLIPTIEYHTNRKENIRGDNDWMILLQWILLDLVIFALIAKIHICFEIHSWRLFLSVQWFLPSVTYIHMTYKLHISYFNSIIYPMLNYVSNLQDAALGYSPSDMSLLEDESWVHPLTILQFSWWYHQLEDPISYLNLNTTFKS